jgi:hypothetical protein
MLGKIHFVSLGDRTEIIGGNGERNFILRNTLRVLVTYHDLACAYAYAYVKMYRSAHK